MQNIPSRKSRNRDGLIGFPNRYTLKRGYCDCIKSFHPSYVLGMPSDRFADKTIKMILAEPIELSEYRNAEVLRIVEKVAADLGGEYLPEPWMLHLRMFDARKSQYVQDLIFHCLIRNRAW